jgi:hypothetical protein
MQCWCASSCVGCLRCPGAPAGHCHVACWKAELHVCATASAEHRAQGGTAGQGAVEHVWGAVSTMCAAACLPQSDRGRLLWLPTGRMCAASPYRRYLWSSHHIGRLADTYRSHYLYHALYVAFWCPAALEASSLLAWAGRKVWQNT